MFFFNQFFCYLNLCKVMLSVRTFIFFRFDSWTLPFHFFLLSYSILHRLRQKIHSTFHINTIKFDNWSTATSTFKRLCYIFSLFRICLRRIDLLTKGFIWFFNFVLVMKICNYLINWLEQRSIVFWFNYLVLQWFV